MGGVAGANAVPAMYEVHEFVIGRLDFGRFRDDEPEHHPPSGATHRAALAKFRTLKSRNSAQSRSVV